MKYGLDGYLSWNCENKYFSKSMNEDKVKWAGLGRYFELVGKNKTWNTWLDIWWLD